MREFIETRPHPIGPAANRDWHTLSASQRRHLFYVHKLDMTEWWLEGYGYEQRLTTSDETVSCCVQCLAETGEAAPVGSRENQCVVHRTILFPVLDMRQMSEAPVSV